MAILYSSSSSDSASMTWTSDVITTSSDSVSSIYQVSFDAYYNCYDSSRDKINNCNNIADKISIAIRANKDENYIIQKELVFNERSNMNNWTNYEYPFETSLRTIQVNLTNCYKKTSIN